MMAARWMMQRLVNTSTLGVWYEYAFYFVVVVVACDP